MICRDVRRALTAGALLLLTACSPGPSIDLRELSVELEEYSLFDLGVTDFDHDGLLDIYTVNHSSPQSMLRNLGDGEFEDVFAGLGIDQDPGFPGLTSTEEAPDADRPGLYVYWVGPELFLEAHDLDDPVSGQILLDTALTVTLEDDAEVSVTEDARSENDTSSDVRFRLDRDGIFALRPVIHALPMVFDIEGLSADSLFVGASHVSPADSRFSFFLRDRHGMAWFDYDSDGDNDLFMTRGGQNGLMRFKQGAFWDQLFPRSGDAYAPDIGDSLGFAKEGCPGRKVAAVDFDNDGQLDIFVGCGREGDLHPKQLFRRTGPSTFTDVAPAVGLDFGGDGSFVWLDADLDGDLDLLFDGDTDAAWYRNDDTRFVRIPVAGGFRDEAEKHLSVADFDNDGDLDVFSSCGCGNVLFENVDGRFEAVDPETLGLPASSRGANWVDIDNDGDQDLHAMPNGVFEQTGVRRFSPTGILEEQTGRFDVRRTSRGIASWFDFDNDGSRDLVFALDKRRRGGRLPGLIFGVRDAVGPTPPDTVQQSFLYENRSGSGNHWLQVELTGPEGNRNAIGARVEVAGGAVRQMQQVGGAEGSLYSQGHYRIYFGLGNTSGIDELIAHWPDGSRTVIAEPPIDRVLELRQD